MKKKNTDSLQQELMDSPDLTQFLSQNQEQFVNKNVAELSGGQKQLLNLASIMAMHPDILILDEVLSVGDAKFRKKSEAKIMSMFDKGVTVLFVSHSLDQVKRLCNKAILLEKGQIISRGSIEEVSKVYEEKTK